MSAVAWLSHGRLSDRPACACPVLAAFGRLMNDMLGHADRQRLKPFIPRLAGSRDGRALKRRCRLIVQLVTDEILRGRPFSLDDHAAMALWQARSHADSGDYQAAMNEVATVLTAHYMG
jgi:hypothetical protein